MNNEAAGYPENNDSDIFLKAKRRALYLLGGKDYSPKAMREKLSRNYPPEICSKTVEYLIEYDYLNEERYARKLAGYLVKKKNLGLYRAKLEMIQKGVSEEAAKLALESYTREELEENLADFVKQKYGDKLESPEDLRRVMSALARKGHGYDEIKKAVRLAKESLAESS